MPGGGAAPPALAHPIRRPPFAGPPDDELGVPVPVRRVIASRDGVVVGVTDCISYSSGFQLSIAIRRRQSPEPAVFPVRGYPPEPVEMRPRISIRFADGRENATAGHVPSAEMMAFFKSLHEGKEPGEPPGPVIGPTGGGGGGTRWDMNYWVWPLPPDGQLTLSCEWEGGEIPSGSAELDGSAIRRAGLSNTKLWEGSSS